MLKRLLIISALTVAGFLVLEHVPFQGKLALKKSQRTLFQPGICQRTGAAC